MNSVPKQEQEVAVHGDGRREKHQRLQLETKIKVPANSSKLKVTEYGLVILFIIVGLAIRLHFLSISNSVIDADEAIVGLMAKHITEGAPWPIFYYGQSYMGSFEALLTAPVFMLLGISSLSLKVVPLLFSLLHIFFVYHLARRITDRFGAAIAAFFVSFGASALTVWGTKARGGFIELVVIGTVALILSIDLLCLPKPKFRNFFLLGLVFGLGWWVNNQIIFYLAPVALIFLGYFPRTIGWGRSIAAAATLLPGFFLGGAPFWYANVVEKPRWQSFWLFESAAGGDIFQHLQGFFQKALPIILGARRFWSEKDIFIGATPLLYTIYLLSLVIFLLALRNRRDNLASFGLILLFCILVPMIFASSQFGWLVQAPRYLLPLYSVLSVIMGVALSWLWHNGRFLGQVLVLFLLGLIGCINFMSNYLGDGVVPGEPFVFREDRVARNHTELYSWLRANNYHHIKTNYWVGYRVAFETKEQITFSIFRGPQQVRIPEYERYADEDDEGVYVLTPHEAAFVSRGFADLGRDFRMTEVGGYVVIDNVRPVISNYARVKIHPEQIWATSRADWVQALVDGDLGTRWGSGQPQQEGMGVEINFRNPIEIVGIDLDSGFWPQDVSRNISIEAQRADGSRCILVDTRGNPALSYVLQGERNWAFFFTAQKIVTLRLIQHGYDAVFDWSLAEIVVFSPNGEEIIPQLSSEGRLLLSVEESPWNFGKL